MGRSALDDPDSRSAVLEILRSGASVGEAAEAIGTTRQSVYRYSKRFPAFAVAMSQAMTDGGRRKEVSRARPIPASPPVEVSPETEEAAEAMGVDVDLVVQTDAFVESDLAVVDKDGLGKLTTRSYLQLVWERAKDPSRTDAARWASLLAPVMFGPTLRAQERRDAVMAMTERKKLEAEQESKVTQGGGLVILEIPRNGSEAPGRGPKPAPAQESIIDAEVGVMLSGLKSRWATSWNVRTCDPVEPCMTKKRKSPMRWRKVTSRPFMRLETRWELRRNGVVLGTVAPTDGGYYWVSEASGRGQNSLWKTNPYATLDDAKSACRDYVADTLAGGAS